MNHYVTVRVYVQSAPDHRTWGEAPIILPAPIFTVKVEFMHRMNGARVKQMTLVMQARNRGCEDRLRDELLQNISQDFEWFADGVPDNSQDGMPTPDEWIIEIIDPDGVLKWLGIDATAVETFKQYQKNDQPVRLPAPGVR